MELITLCIMLACANNMLLQFYLFKFETPGIPFQPQGNVPDTVYHVVA